MSEPAVTPSDATERDPYAGLEPAAAQAMRKLELGLAALLLLGFAALQVASTLKGAGSVAPVVEGSLDTLAGWEPYMGPLVALGVSLLTVAVIFAFTVGVRLVRAVRDGLQTARASRITLGMFLLAYGVMQLVPLVVISGLPAGSFLPQEGETPHALTLAQPLRFGGEGSALELEGPPVEVHRESFAVWLKVPAGAQATVQVGGEPVEPGSTVEISNGSRLAVGPHVGTIQVPTPNQVLWRYALGQVLALLVLLGVCRGVGGSDFLGELGLTLEGAGSEALRGVTAWLAFLPLYAGLLVGGVVLSNLLGLNVSSHVLVRTLEREGLALAPVILLQAVILAPLVEEILFRGFLQQGFSRPLGPWRGLIAASLAFGCVHEGLGQLIPMSGLGFLFGGLFLSSSRRSLVGSISAHATHNGANLALLIVLVSVAAA